MATRLADHRRRVLRYEAGRGFGRSCAEPVGERRLGGRAVAIPGSRLALVPPDGFSLAKEFAGLQGDKASVLVVELPASAYEQLATAISAGTMAKQGVEIASGEDLTMGSFRLKP